MPGSKTLFTMTTYQSSDSTFKFYDFQRILGLSPIFGEDNQQFILFHFQESLYQIEDPFPVITDCPPFKAGNLCHKSSRIAVVVDYLDC